MLIDSHAHLDMEEFDGDLKEVLARAFKSGIDRVISVGIDLASSRKSLELARKIDFVSSTVGYHPHNAGEAEDSLLRELAELTTDPNVVAWGEIGLDFYRRHSTPESQIDALERQLEMAEEVGLPVIIHDRDAHDKLAEILKQRKVSRGGVIHCFSGDYQLAKAFIDMGFYISLSGVVTYKNATLAREVAAKIPLQHLLVETDAPFLAPTPYRGKRNEPAFVKFTAQEIARLREMDVAELSRATSENAKTLFKLGSTS
jgi:TatD DNase family protein